MNHSKSILTILGFIFTSAIAQGQNEGDISQLYMTGKWIASCPLEVIDKAAIRICELCPILINPHDMNHGETNNLEMTFQNDSIRLNQNGRKTTVLCERNKYNHSFSFALNNKNYYFRVFMYDDKRILENSGGLVLVLEKIN